MSIVRLLSLSFLVIFFCNPSFGQSQVFSKKAPPGEIISRFNHAYDPTFAFGDIDSDGDEDVIISGSSYRILPGFNPGTNSIYINDGTGSFQAKSSGCFPETEDGPIFLEDIDGDNDLDFILTGILQGPSIALYFNDGAGNFSKSDSNTFPTYTNYDVALGDINNDGIMDILVSSNQFTAFLGDGNGNFTDTILSQVDGLTNCALLIDDLNNDGNSDIIATGEFNGAHAFRYYEGQGNLIFNQITTTIPGLSKDPSLAIGDVNNDGYLDFGIMGEDVDRDPVTSLYMGTSSSTFLKANVPGLIQLQEGNIHLVDFTGDGNLDIFATGVISPYSGVVCALENTNPTWTNVATDDFFKLQEAGSSVVHDVNGDNLPEIFLGGEMRDISYRPSYITCEYLNKGNGEFYRTDGSHFWNEEIKFKITGDFTGDGYFDILSGGKSPSIPTWIDVYKNDGNGSFTTESTNLPHFRITDITAINANGDNYEDVIAYHDYNNGPTVYLNTGSGLNFNQGSFYLDWSYEGGLSVGDIDGDGDEDFTYLTQFSWNSPYVVHVKLNNGSGNFTDLSMSNPPEVGSISKTMFADFNDDGFTDLFFPKVKRLYHWDQSITEFVEDTLFTTGAVAQHSSIPYTSVADFDQNGRLDIMIGFDASNGTGGAFFDLILQDTSGVFTNDSTFSFPASEVGSIDTADFDQDGDIDLVYVGTNGPHQDFLAVILENDGQGNFTDYPYHELTRMSEFTWFMDVDNDGDKDIMQAGIDHHRTRYIGQVHENHSCTPIHKDTTVFTGCTNSFKWEVTGCEYKTSGKYSKRVINSQNCYEFYELNLNIQGFEVQVTNLDTGLACTTDTLFSYQWHNCSNGSFTPIAGETSFELFPGNNGSFALVATNSNGCSDTSACFEINTISLEEYSSNKLNVSIYPNPTQSTIQVNGFYQGGNFDLYDARGKRVLSGTLEAGEKGIDISDFKDGVYFLKLISGDDEVFIRVLKV